MPGACGFLTSQRPPSEHEADVLRMLTDANVSPRIPDYGYDIYDRPSHSKALVLDLLGTDYLPSHVAKGGQVPRTYAKPIHTTGRIRIPCLSLTPARQKLSPSGTLPTHTSTILV